MMRIARPGTALTILVYLSFWLLDQFTLPQAYQEIWIIRAGGDYFDGFATRNLINTLV